MNLACTLRGYQPRSLLRGQRGAAYGSRVVIMYSQLKKEKKRKENRTVPWSRDGGNLVYCMEYGVTVLYCKKAMAKTCARQWRAEEPARRGAMKRDSNRTSGNNQVQY